MKKLLVIGLGNFGLNLARVLTENGCEVLGIDSGRDPVDRAKDFVDHAIIADATSREVLSSLPLKDFEAAIVSTGQEMAKSILISFYLKEMGFKNIISRAISDDHGEILKKIGVSSIVFPEKDMAVRIANRLSLKNALDYLPLGEDYGISEVRPPSSFHGKSLKDLQITNRFNCQVVAIRLNPDAEPGETFSDSEKNFLVAPRAESIVSPDSTLVLIGKNRDIEKIQNL